jgi:hypothetical protein
VYIKAQINPNTIILGEFNIPLSPKDRLSRQKNQQGIRIYWHYRSNGLNTHLQNIPPKAKEYTFFSAAHGTFSQIDYILEHKVSFNINKKIEIISCIL